ncbi:MAG: hypothetical protein QOI25_418 [Mycobacterium sp.]|nr:hypothetical protein [Mycobacterium sp.]
MNAITRRITATAALLAAPALIALGTATSSHAETTIRYNGPSISGPGTAPGLPAPEQHAQARHPRTPPPPEQQVSGTGARRILSTDHGYRFAPQPWRLPAERGRRGRGRDNTPST